MLIGPQNSVAAALIATNLQSLRREIAAAALASHRTEESVTLIAVSKGHAADRVLAASELGLSHFGESYLQEALPKMEQLGALPVCWHYIGRIQANKTRSIAERFDWVHGVDRLHVAERLSAQRAHYAAPLQICLQVNIDRESAKAGVDAADTLALAQAVHALPRLQLRGLMCILPAGRGSQADRASFAALRALQQQINASGPTLDTLSMGMSEDFRDAILEGATMVRIGTALFGPRSDT
jgi:PLP dependent protein